MTPHEERPREAAGLAPEDLADEGAAELPDREAMSLIADPGGGPLFMMQPQLETLPIDSPQPMPDAPIEPHPGDSTQPTPTVRETATA